MSDFAGDVGEMVNAGAEVLADEVAGEVKGEAFLHAVDGFEGVAEGFCVAGVCYDDVLGGDGGKVGGGDEEGL